MSSSITIDICMTNTVRPIFDMDPRTMSSNAPTVFILEDSVYARGSLEPLIRSQGWQPQTCESVQEVLVQPRQVAPSSMILAFSSADPNCLEVQKRIARECAEIPIVIVADYADIPTTVEAMKAGAVDFLVKPLSEEKLVAALRQCFVRSRAVIDRGVETRELRSCYTSLSPRERQVMALVVTGLLNKQVGAELGISEITVKAHRGQVMQKMRAATFAHLVNMGSRLRVMKLLRPGAVFL